MTVHNHIWVKTKQPNYLHLINFKIEINRWIIFFYISLHFLFPHKFFHPLLYLNEFSHKTLRGFSLRKMVHIEIG